MRLVREILVADAEPAMLEADALGRARRYLQVMTDALGLRAGGLFLRAVATGHLDCAASTLPASVSRLLTDPAGRLGTLARRAAEERRAFVLKHASEEPLVQALREADPAIETVAIVPLADRDPVGILVLAGSEAALAPEIIRTLNPVLRLMAVLVSPFRDGFRIERADSAELDATRAARDAYARTISELRGRVAELEAAADAARSRSPEVAAVRTTTIEAVQAAAVLSAAASEALAASAASETGTPTEKIVVVVDAAPMWEQYELPGHRVVVVPPSADLAARIREEAPVRVILNVAAPGALPALVLLREQGVLVPVTGVIDQPGTERVLGLDRIDAVGHPLDVEALVAAVLRSAPRGARVLAAGRDAQVLLKMRQALVKQGKSVSMARDTKQIEELVGMVRPQLIVSDLELPMREGYELIVRAAMMTPIPALVVIVPPGGDPSAVLHEKLRDRLAAGIGMNAKQWLVDALVEKRSAKPATATGAAHPPR